MTSLQTLNASVTIIRRVLVTQPSPLFRAILTVIFQTHSKAYFLEAQNQVQISLSRTEFERTIPV
jgi:hypothetical protein